MTPSEIIAWSEQKEAAGTKDAMGGSWTDWLIAVKRMNATQTGQTMELFA